jgi:hypothetical protein
MLQERRRQIGKRNLKWADETGLATTPIAPIYPTCTSSYSARYLNLPATQAAIHVRAGTVPTGKWAGCGLTGMYDFNYESELPNYKEWVKSKPFDILIYNGDADYILCHIGNQNWIVNGLQATKTQDWRKWKGSDKQVRCAVPVRGVCARRAVAGWHVHAACRMFDVSDVFDVFASPTRGCVARRWPATTRSTTA